ncbi:hypothetical protein [Aquicoccus porphyridii]|uniref:hypothetical protein n=1 Tax=Aquicoccus porphyridii TaxID=1852029 RepID=UPI00273D44DC|nr:hypothetical protein [Aquicoccus porphyridii]
MRHEPGTSARRAGSGDQIAQAGTLTDVIKQYLNPYRFARAYAESGELLMGTAEVQAISPILPGQPRLTDKQARLLIGFLASLDDAAATAEHR